MISLFKDLSNLFTKKKSYRFSILDSFCPTRDFNSFLSLKTKPSVSQINAQKHRCERRIFFFFFQLKNKQKRQGRSVERSIGEFHRLSAAALINFN